MNTIKSFALVVVVFGGCLVVPNLQAAIVYSEAFNTDTATTANTLATYPDFSFLGGALKEVQVIGDVLSIAPQGAGLTQDFYVNGFSGNLIVEADIGKNSAAADFNAGLVIGDNRLLFHPGLSGGIFRVEGPGGFFNESMGFTPAAGNVLHHIEVSILAATGAFSISVTDANNPLNIYTASFVNSGYMPGDIIGFTTHGNLGTGTRFARFDNLEIQSSVPLPGAVWLFGSGLIGLIGIAGRNKA